MFGVAGTWRAGLSLERVFDAETMADAAPTGGAVAGVSTAPAPLEVVSTPAEAKETADSAMVLNTLVEA